MISFAPLDAGRDADALLQASARHFGSEGYQHLPRYLEWLYRANPVGRGTSDCLVARRDGAIVGCMHRMRLPLAGNEAPDDFAVLHNHFVAEELRSGPGVLLLRRAVKNLGVGFAPGVQAPLDQVYRRLGFVEHPGFWLMRTLSPIAAGVQLARARTIGPGPLRIDVARLQRRFGDLSITANPDDETIADLCRAMRRDTTGEAAVPWTIELVRWRYFHPLGPRHLLVKAPGGTASAVFSLGKRRGLTVARLLESHSADPRFLGQVMRVMRAAGAAMGLVFSTDCAMVAQLTTLGWRLRDNGTFSFRTPGPSLSIGAAATDVGFEAFNTEWS